MHDHGAILEFRLPDLGEGLADAELISWSVGVGDHVDLNQIIAEVETAKAVVALPCPYAGTVAELLAEPGETVPVGAALIRVRDEGANEHAFTAIASAGGAPAEEPLAGRGGSATGGRGDTGRDAGKAGGAPDTAPADGDGSAPANGGPAPGDGSADSRASVLVGYGPQGEFRSRRRAPARPGAVEEGASGSRTDAESAADGGAAVDSGLAARVSAESGSAGRGAESGRAGQVAEPGSAGPAAESGSAGQVAEPGSVDRVTEPGGVGEVPGEPRSGGRVPAVPAARLLAKELGVDLGRTAGSGPGGAVTVADVRAAATTSTTRAGRTTAAQDERERDLEDREIRTPVTGVRKRTAAAMVASATTIPQAGTFLTVDCTAAMEVIEHLRATASFTGLPLTPLTLVAKAVIAALAEYPAVNAHWDERAQQIVTKKYVNLGIAAATERGLLVPNVKQAQAMSLRSLCEAIGRCVQAAREGAATPADLTGGTFTVTNVGVFGVDAGIPLVNPGEAAILCLGAITRRPWVHEERLAIRWVTTLALSFDHRLVDGELAARFLATVGELLTDPLALLSR
ncbi:2-oxo acid dehydrogenase subunit E2 [Nocardia higoensis]|uniref:Dihydrolipoamide acetyltransferase component of pyruvate dehydrogenase complex n=1 Tax=Nocardia higoensis TaxID=228599 RepID=A0ABS0DD41_9NOCA|nr:dihydrolipoamide acetyltransferase family protein [Nocardia higoensis]MBF6356351.1 2-oxo acid dehydrogenase subunit E2 [Nocardia higoensis]